MWTALGGMGAVAAYAVAQWGAMLVWSPVAGALLAAGVAGASLAWLLASR
jgi:cytochrome c biogenesis factor